MASIDALMGLGGLTDEEKAKQLANTLRGQKRASDLFSMSTLKPVASQAQRESASILDSAQRAGATRQKEIDRARQEEQFGLTQALQREQDAQRQKNFEATMAFNREKEAADQLEKEQSNNPALRAFNNMGEVSKRKFIEAEAGIRGADKTIGLVEQNRDAFGQGTAIGEYFPELTPKGIMEAITTGQKAEFTSPQQRARFNVFSRAYEDVHRLAGAQVSKHEKQRIEGFLPSPNDDPDVIINKVKNAKELAEEFRQINIEFYGGTHGQQGRERGDEATDDAMDTGDAGYNALPDDVKGELSLEEYNSLSAEDRAYIAGE